ncbi:hypothetical protein MA16_Dca013719 [Dendrobium catenatum]|uniref:Uncharacterized protein n=1 Tax=Dendrobium catenatum TaxID=906689 RepID=A0A2I0VWB9_9ASPA|nr:hypothetical protein MA16_Dca013719 [Dendrobium catenatum]
MAQREKLDRRGVGNFTTRQIALISALNEQCSDIENKINKVRRDGEIEIARVEAKIRAAKAQLEIGAEAIRNKYFPACLYRPMSSPELKRACWAEYVAVATKQERQVVELTEASQVEAVRAYADIARMRHMLNFVKSTKGYMESLQQYIVKKIGLLDDAGQVRAAKKLRGLLEISWPPDVPPKTNTGGIRDEDVVVSSAGPSTAGASSSGPQTVGDFRAKLRAASVPFKHAEKPSKDKHSRGSKKDGSAGSSASEK